MKQTHQLFAIRLWQVHGLPDLHLHVCDFLFSKIYRALSISVLCLSKWELIKKNIIILYQPSGTAFFHAIPDSSALWLSAGMSSCQVIIIPANTFKVLPCKLRSNLAERKWEFGESAGHFHYPSPEGGLVVVAQADKQETYECWSVEEGFRQLLANYCVRGEAKEESTTLTGRSHTPQISQEEIIILPGEARSPQINTKTYWNELIVVCALLVFSLVVFSLFVVYRNRDHMKSMLKEGECPNMQQKKPRIVGKPAENLPLNGNTVTTSASDHKGYQTLNDNYICSTPPHECSSPDNSKSFSESEKRPLNLRESHVEISPTCPRPRVRLGSEIKDSIVWGRLHVIWSDCFWTQRKECTCWERQKHKREKSALSWRDFTLHRFCTLSLSLLFLSFLILSMWSMCVLFRFPLTLLFKCIWSTLKKLRLAFRLSRTAHGNVTSIEMASWPRLSEQISESCLSQSVHMTCR